uniref:Uncharacterized protein n=1 Tax=Physcomitrium patens TaxID=3218 RepID=A0A2K1JMZ3_PHYPA|nr:hypothetical protein PHYPA_017747 [Physcomitrium patens]
MIFIHRHNPLQNLDLVPEKIYSWTGSELYLNHECLESRQRHFCENLLTLLANVSGSR